VVEVAKASGGAELVSLTQHLKVGGLTLLRAFVLWMADCLPRTWGNEHAAPGGGLDWLRSILSDGFGALGLLLSRHLRDRDAGTGFDLGGTGTPLIERGGLKCWLGVVQSPHPRSTFAGLDVLCTEYLLTDEKQVVIRCHTMKPP